MGAALVGVTASLSGCGHSHRALPLPPANDVALSCTHGDTASSSALDPSSLPGLSSSLAALRQRAKDAALPTSDWVADSGPGGKVVAYVRRSGGHIVDIVFVAQGVFGTSGWKATGDAECLPANMGTS